VLAELEELFPRGTVSTMRAAVGTSSTPGMDGWRTAPAITATADASTGAVGPGGFPEVDDQQQYLYTGAPIALTADAEVLSAMRADADLRAAFDDTGIVLLTPSVDGPIEVTLPDGRVEPGSAVSHRFVPTYATRLLITEARADALGVDLVPITTLVHLDAAITAGQRDGIEDLVAEGGRSLVTSGEAILDVQWSSPPAGPTPAQLELLLAGVALALSMFVVGVSLALAAAESKDERDVLTIAGAPPAALARSAGARAWLLAVIGGLMAVPVGFLPVVVFTYASGVRVFGDRPPLVFPTRTVLLLVLVVPAAVALASWAASATAQRLRPVRVSTAVFE